MDPQLVSAVVLLVLVCDPFGNIPIVIAALRDVPVERRRRVVLRECLFAFLVLVTFVFIGGPFMRLLGLSDLALQIGGGVVLMIVALRMVFLPPEGVYGPLPGGEPFIFPLAVPSIAGPSALATVLLLVAREPGRMLEWIAAVAIAIGLCALVLAFAERLQRLLGERATSAFERLMGLILAAIAVEMLLQGIRDFAAGL
jgi:small neutral amino acid transporter SnatA (MarC family)